jgi:ribonucleoside-triphosphate reductase
MPKTQVLRRQPCEVFSRIVGYIRPVAQWNDGKQAEFEQRKTFVISKK